MSSTRPIFLVGCARSGTTLLSTMLHAHPRIAMPPETRFLVPAYYGRARFGDLQLPENRRALAESITGKGSKFRDLGLNRKRTVQAIVDGPPTIGSAFGIIWQEFASDRGKARWGEKRPAYWETLDAVRRLFPDAQIIHLVRDGRACAASLKKVDWWRSGVPGAAASWVLSNRVLDRLGRKLPAHSYYYLRYEDLLADPRGELTALCGFLEESFDEAMLDFASAAGDIVPERKTWHQLTRSGLDTSRVDAWRTSLTPAEIGLIELIGRNAMHKHGYAVSGVAERPAARAVVTSLSDLEKRSLSMARRRVRDAVQQRRDLNPVAYQA
ncbi:sulfotransferase [uncultured Jatrophihabitans sp.]|uniref:sulfotransferase family protein n=1 Tax=uncultured Jatrophihabitans sp. TaxID=1610747 RepID=UPI0035CA261C